MTRNSLLAESLSENPLPELIKKIRNTNNLTQASFGKLFQPPVTQPTVARWEKGEQNPDRIHFLTIASLLNLTFEELLELIKTPQNIINSFPIENQTLTPNKQHLSILNRGVKVWNRWRINNPEVVPDLSGADFLVHDLSGVDLSYAKLREANLSDTDLSQAKLLHADLGSANLNKANLSNADLREADLSNADLLAADLREANLNRTNLENANLSFSLVYGVSVWDIRLKGAKQLQLNISPQKTSPIYVNDVRAAFAKSLERSPF